MILHSFNLLQQQTVIVYNIVLRVHALHTTTFGVHCGCQATFRLHLCSTNNSNHNSV